MEDQNVSQWRQILGMAHKDEKVQKRLKMLYDNSNVPLSVRDRCSEWIERQSWGWELGINIDSASQFYEGLLAELQREEAACQEFIKKCGIQEDINTIKEKFGQNPGRLAEIIDTGLKQELLILQSIEAGGDIEFNNIPMYTQPLEQEDEEFRHKSAEVKIHLMQTTKSIEELKKKQMEFLVEKKDLSSEIREKEKALKMERLANTKKNLGVELNKMKDEIMQVSKDLFTLRQRIVQELNKCDKSFGILIKEAWKEIRKWQKNQKLYLSGLGKADESSLDILNRWCEEVATYLIEFDTLLKKADGEYKRVGFESEEAKSVIPKLTKQLQETIEEHLKKIFIIDKHPPQVIKIASKKSLGFQMGVCFLGSKSLALHLGSPRVTAELYAEKDIEKALSSEKPPKSVGKIENGKDFMMEYQACQGKLFGHMNSVQLRDVPRLDKTGKDEWVTDKKYAMVFSTRVTLGEVTHNIKLLSNPIVLTSQSSQEWAAKGTVFWDAVFSEMERKPFEEETVAKWPEVAKIIDALFKETTKLTAEEGKKKRNTPKQAQVKGLTPEQLEYLGRIALRKTNDLNCDINHETITKDDFFKTRLPGPKDREFSFWKWMFACMNVVRDKVKKEWHSGLITGFISREKADALLRDCETGTFLLRFSEGQIQNTQSAAVCGNLTLAVVEKDPENQLNKVFHIKDHLSASAIGEKGLSQILQAMEVEECTQRGSKKNLLWTLYPNREFDEAFADYLTDTDESNDGYTPTQQKIEVQLVKGRKRQKRNGNGGQSPMSDSVASPAASEFSQSNIDMSTMSPGCSTITEEVEFGDQSENSVVLHNFFMMPQPDGDYSGKRQRTDGEFGSVNEQFVNMLLMEETVETTDTGPFTENSNFSQPMDSNVENVIPQTVQEYEGTL